MSGIKALTLNKETSREELAIATEVLQMYGNKDFDKLPLNIQITKLHLPESRGINKRNETSKQTTMTDRRNNSINKHQTIQLHMESLKTNQFTQHNDSKSPLDYIPP